ncbi:hypothetical protein N7532_003539 [Penicillium argentinense]|uniref:NAD-dependent epimerase/dehydratase domain-containing protein n=1 Tax=Penicillium argentinense TaxID=1131581 RepID=A0A9W9FN71_9EURO|nr:uncharacterized protein N7532_003539 [Penicillium argentinense]KAJ5103010.1 hypothetical protein N7532_003539 [Penicillium argentinense]
MPNILILGGSGYLGLALGRSLVQSGTHIVWGTARSVEKAKLLATNEITPVEAEIADAEQLQNIILTNSIDVVVDTSSAYEHAGEILRGVISAATTRKEALAKEGAVGPKIGFVYTSGAWVHGSPGVRLNDLAPVGNVLAQDEPATVVAWRPAHEQAILAARDHLNVAIMRPYIIYGRGSWVFDSWWGPLAEAAKTGSDSVVKIPADISARAGVVHVDDVASVYHAAIDRLDGQLGSWPVFDVLTETISLVEIMENSKTVFQIHAPIEYIGSIGNPFLEALSISSKGDASRAKTVLGWTPKRTEFLLNLPVYIRAWQSSK